MQWDTRQSQPIFGPANHKSVLQYPTDRPTANRLWLCKSLVGCAGVKHPGGHFSSFQRQISAPGDHKLQFYVYEMYFISSCMLRVLLAIRLQDSKVISYFVA